MFSIFKKKKKIIFIHIPKTGGSTFIGLLKDSLLSVKERTRVPTHKTKSVKHIEVKHINFNDPMRRFAALDFFTKNTVVDSEVYMLVRNPLDRLFSEFNFQYSILGGKNGNPNAAIIAQLPKRPRNFEQYISFPHTQNYQVKFLLGRKLADPTPVSDEEFNLLLTRIESVPVHLGITENYTDFLAMFEKQTSIKLKASVTIRKKTPAKLKDAVSEKVKNKLREVNDLDYRLYEFAKKKTGSYQTGKFDFLKSDEFII